MDKAAHITAELVSEAKRMDFLPTLFGRQFMKGEALVYSWMSRLCSKYTGGYWEFYELSNGGGFMAPRQEPMSLSWANNGFSGTMSSEAAGIVASLYALNQLANDTEEDHFINRFYWLREYAQSHPESELIFGAID